MKRDVIGELKKFDIYDDFVWQKGLKNCVYRRSYKKGQMLYIEEDPRDRIYFLISGYVKLVKEDDNGNSVYYHYIKNLEVFPWVGMITDHTYNHSAEAATDIEVLYIPKDCFEQQLHRNHRLLSKVIHKLSAIIKRREEQVIKMKNGNAKLRVMQTLENLMVDLGEKIGEDIIIDCPITIKEIANVSGTSRETVSKVLKQLKQERVMTVTGKKMKIYSPNSIYEASANLQFVD